MTTTIKPIETRYAGCRFRSRLEARWAVFFNYLEVPWEYEPEGFELADGSRYLPDFRLPTLNTWFEVKGVEPEGTEAAKLRAFSEQIDGRLIVAIGAMPDTDTFDCDGQPLGSFNGGSKGSFDLWRDTCDGHYAWTACPVCMKFGIEFDARGGRVCGWQAHGRSNGFHWDDKAYWGNHPLILNAYDAARSARFEHGERG